MGDHPKALLERAGLRAKKSWGQNFLHDRSVLEHIAQASGASAKQTVVELGAGLGALTEFLLALGGRVVAVERDPDLMTVLEQRFGGQKAFELRKKDAAQLDYAALAGELGGPLNVVGNLPYNIASRIVVSMADAVPHVSLGVVMVQREVADRMQATPGGREYGLLSVLVQRSFNIERVRNVAAGSFYPPPKIQSAVVALRSRARLETLRDDRLVRAARAAFDQRRKTLRNSVAGHLGSDPIVTAGVIRDAGIDPGRRAETLSLDEFAVLGDALDEAGLLYKQGDTSL